MKLIFVCLLLVSAALAVTVKNCKCADGLEPREMRDGAKCLGIRKKIITPCNLPLLPKCTCTGDVSGIVNDGQGTYCSKSENGAELKRWDCENKEDWEEYKKKQA